MLGCFKAVMDLDLLTEYGEIQCFVELAVIFKISLCLWKYIDEVGSA